jgi:signal transduction histidine kinase
VTASETATSITRTGRPILLVAAAVPVLTAGLLYASAVPLGQYAAFLPAFLAVVWVCDVLTAVLLIAQYRAGGGPRLLALSWAYVWSATVIALHALVFPGLVTPTGLLGATPSSAPWLWTAWHVGMPVLIGAALAPWPAAVRTALSGDARRTRRSLAGVAVVVAAGAATAALVTVGAEHVPVILVDGDYRLLTERFGAWIVGVDVAALTLGVVGVVRRRDPGRLESWALVAVAACCGDVVVTLMARERFTVGWYGARALALTAALVVLGAMVHELTVLYRRVHRRALRLDADNRQLQEANALRDRLTAVVSHELRGPLTGIQGYLELLEDVGGALPPAELDRMLARCGVLTRRLTLLTEDLLTVAATDHGSLAVHVVTLDVDQQLREAMAGVPELDVRMDPPAGTPDTADTPAGTSLAVLADPLRVQQILTNLLRNAQKYGKAPVRLGAGVVDGGLVQLRVSDAGPGVPEAFVPQLFDRFTRADTTAQARGTGLGLSIVRDLARAHHGDARYDRDTNTFLVTLPQVPQVLPAAGTRVTGVADGSATGEGLVADLVPASASASAAG